MPVTNGVTVALLLVPCGSEAAGLQAKKYAVGTPLPFARWRCYELNPASNLFNRLLLSGSCSLSQMPK